jgi:citronellol/citronellal dehydrogenase
MIEAEGGGKIVFVAPAPDAGLHAEVARAALENLARTLSIEWSRHAIRTTAILPGARTTDDDVSGLVAYLASPAGDYFSGCVFSLGGP